MEDLLQDSIRMLPQIGHYEGQVQSKYIPSNKHYATTEYTIFLQVKDTLWEGGVRGAGFIWSANFKSTPRPFNHLISIQDWLPTLYEAGGTKVLNSSIRLSK